MLNWKDIENYINLSKIPFKFVNKTTPTKTINPDTYTGVYQKTFQNKETVKKLIDEGFTFFSLEHSFNNLLAYSLCSEIDDIFGVTSEAQIFGSKSSKSISFPVHLDDNPIFVFQTYGSIDWIVYENKTTNLGSRDYINSKVIHSKLTSPVTYTLNPGDFLYVPQRTFHQIKLTEPRLTVAINCFSKELVKELDREFYEIEN